MKPPTPGARALLCALALSIPGGSALAQKVPGTTLSPTEPPMMPPAATFRPQPVRPAPPVAAAAIPGPAAGPAAGAERDAEARRLADQLPLDPATANLRGGMPADVPGTASRLGLRIPNGTATDLRNRPNTREAVIDALRH